MAEGNGEVAADRVAGRDSADGDFRKLLDYGLDAKVLHFCIFHFFLFIFHFSPRRSFVLSQVAGKLDEIYSTGKLSHAELDERALDALKEFPSEGALVVLEQFVDSNLEHVSNKSAYLCGVMKTYRFSPALPLPLPPPLLFSSSDL